MSYPGVGGIAVLVLLQAILEILGDVVAFGRWRWLERHETTVWAILIAVLLVLVIILLCRGQ